MLHIDDIKERLVRNPIPSDILKIRDNITNTFSNLEFIEKGHKYYLHKEDGSTVELPSVSAVCHKFQPFVDWNMIQLRQSVKLGIPVEKLKRSWKENNIKATTSGTIAHEFGEAHVPFAMGEPDSMPEYIFNRQFIDGFLIPCGNKEVAISQFWKDMLQVDQLYPVMAEAKIYTKDDNMFGIKNHYCGTFDLLTAFKSNDGKWKLILNDYKTNESLENDYNQKHKNTLLEPFTDLIDEPLSLYTIQLSLYSIGLLQLGYEIADRKIIWLKDDGTYEKISVPDVTNQLIEVLKNPV